MTNTQQTVVGQVEQSQEEIQLTELLPVEQYRIQETADYTGATDALKALRSFSQVDQPEFSSQEFNTYDQYDEVKTLNGCEKSRRKRARWMNSEDEEIVLEGSRKDRDSDSGKVFRNGEEVGNRYQKGGKAKGRGKGAWNGEGEVKEGTRRSRVVREEEDDIELSDDSIFLDVETIQDEIYAFQHDSDGDVSIETDFEHVNVDNLEDEDLEDDNLEDNSEDNLGNGLEDSNLEDNNYEHNDLKDKNLKGRNKDRSPKGKNSRRVNFASKKDLRKKIDAIIHANILLEQENNNETQEEGNNSLKSQSKKFICVICNARFKGSGGLRNHYKVAHATGPVYKCDECGKEFPLKERLKLHMRTHTGFKPYKCLECDKCFARGGQLLQHRRTHSNVKPYQCSLCSGTFTCAANLALHMKRHNGQKDHKCEICGRGFVRRDALKKHLECLHHDVRSFLCVICNKTLKGHLPQHMRTHAQDRPHGCATCGQRFAQKSQLTVHQRTHSGQRPFRCLVCWQAFAHSTALKLHTRRHTGERPFKCEECNAGFTQLPHWKKHMKCIHGRSEPYCCRRCKHFFRIKSELEAHQKNCKQSLKLNSGEDNQVEIFSNRIKYTVMPVEKMRLLLAVLLKRISKQEKLDELGFGKRLIDLVLHDSLISAGKKPVKRENYTEFECLKKNVDIFLEWTVPKSHWAKFKRMKMTTEEILETLTTTAND